MKYTRTRLWLFITVAALCGLHAWMAASVSRTFSTTSDEIVHLTSGYIYWVRQDYRFQPENGNFPQRLAALPLLAMDLQPPPTTGAAWQSGDMWSLAHDFFYKQGNDPAAMLAAGRTMIALLSAVLCFVIFLWSRELFGWKAGLLSLGLAAFSPELLAHGGLATSDTAAALGFTLAVLAWWRLLHRITLGRLLIAGLCAGLLAVSKHSVILFAPMAVLMVIVRLLRSSPLLFVYSDRHFRMSGWRRWPALTGLLVATALLSVAVIWSFYGFRYQATPATGDGPADFVRPWENVLLESDAPQPFVMADGHGLESIPGRPGVVQAGVRFMRDHRLLPEAWLYGLTFVEINSRARLAFFAGDYRTNGWKEFFPVSFLLKTTLPALALIAAGLVFVGFAPARKRLARLYGLSPLLILLAVYWTFSLQSKLNIGHRHLLPTYSACYVIAGAGLLLARRRRIWMTLPVALAVWHLAESIMIRPDYLAYFNPIAGGPSEAHRYFVDSSIDWGQDLPRLHQWLDQHADDQPVFLSYFGTGSPAHEGIRATRFGDGYFDRAPHTTPPPLTGGIYCISATMFRRVYTQVRGHWSPSYENAYQELDRWITHLGTRPSNTPVTDIDGRLLGPEELNGRLFRYEQLLFGRLCHFLETRPPDARVGRSILIWRLSDTEVGFALSAPLSVVNRRLLQLRAEQSSQ